MIKKLKFNNKGRRGQFFSIYLVFITLTMSIFAIMMYYHQQGIIGNSIVSPVSVLRLEDNREIFEMQEETMIKQAVKLAGGDTTRAKEEFVNSLMKNESNVTRDFIFSDLYYQEQEIVKEVYDNESEKKTFIGAIYDFVLFGNEIIVTRKDIGKYIRLRAPVLSKINYGTDLIWNFGEKKYIIKLN